MCVRIIVPILSGVYSTEKERKSEKTGSRASRGVALVKKKTDSLNYTNDKKSTCISRERTKRRRRYDRGGCSPLFLLFLLFSFSFSRSLRKAPSYEEIKERKKKGERWRRENIERREWQGLFRGGRS